MPKHYFTADTHVNHANVLQNAPLPTHLGAPGNPDWKFLLKENARMMKWPHATKFASLFILASAYFWRTPWL